MQITCHEDFSVFQNYVKFAVDDSVNILTDAWS